MIIGERIVKIDQFQVSPNNTYSVDYSANGVLPDYSSRGGGKVYFFANNELKAQAFMIQSSWCIMNDNHYICKQQKH